MKKHIITAIVASLIITSSNSIAASDLDIAALVAQRGPIGYCQMATQVVFDSVINQQDESGNPVIVSDPVGYIEMIGRQSLNVCLSAFALSGSISKSDVINETQRTLEVLGVGGSHPLDVAALVILGSASAGWDAGRAMDSKYTD